METEERGGDSLGGLVPVRGEPCMAYPPPPIPTAVFLWPDLSRGSECWQKLPAVTASPRGSRWGLHAGSLGQLTLITRLRRYLPGFPL